MASPIAEGVEDLRGLALPDPPGFWPLAPGWYVVALLLLALAVALAVRARRRSQENRYRRLALAELALIRTDSRAQVSGEVLTQLAALLKRTALVAFPRQEVASLAGSSWLTFLDEQCPGANLESNGGHWLAEGIYGQPGDLEVLRDEEIEPLFAAAEIWIRRHEKRAA